MAESIHPTRNDVATSSKSVSSAASSQTDDPVILKRYSSSSDVSSSKTKDNEPTSTSERSNIKATTSKQENESQRQQPNYTKANALPFFKLCKRFEILWRQRKKSSNKATKQELLEYLLPSNLRNYLGETSSPFPLLRLIIPERDVSRPHLGMKEKTIALVWGKAMGLSKESKSFQKLLQFNDPIVAGPTAVGDLSMAIYEVVTERYSSTGSNITIGQINHLLDELAAIKRGREAARIDSHQEEEVEVEIIDANKLEEKQTKQNQRIQWVEKLLSLNLSPLEHKWIVRVCLQKLEFGIGWKSILSYYHKWSMELYNANNSLKKVCDKLSDPEFVRQKEDELQAQRKADRDEKRQTHMPKSQESAMIGNTLAPMLAKKTSCTNALYDMEARHKHFAKKLSKDDDDDDDDVGMSSSLALLFPAFICEIKMDGERIIAHVNRGIVTLQTRNSKWYSQIYSPIIGPALRKSISKYDVDVILDGEMLAWDDINEEIIPFGANRSVAKARRDWCNKNQMIDSRDLNLHENEMNDLNVVTLAMSESLNDDGGSSAAAAAVVEDYDLEEEDDPGSMCWMKFVVFDILYVGGPEANKLLNVVTEDKFKDVSIKRDCTTPGSILNLDLYQRKRILYELIQVQEKEVEIVKTIVVRPDASLMDGADYFIRSRALDENQYPSTISDSINCALDGMIPDLDDIDDERRGGRSDKEIHRERAHCLETIYNEVVEQQCQEGLIFKDLASPYILGQPSRSLGYWTKLKADYEAIGHASDIDVIVLGGFFAVGMKRAGSIDHFLVGCIDSTSTSDDDEVVYMTLTKINGGSTSFENRDKILQHTGFRKGTKDDSVQYGKWFKLNNHGRDLPDFISNRSFQRSIEGDDFGWKCDKSKTYPDLWIRPEDSFVLTINASEIISSDAFSAGVTLRFARIRKIRLEGFQGEKSSEEVETVESLHQLYYDRQSQMRESSLDDFSSRNLTGTITALSSSEGYCRFLTPGESERKKQLSIRRRKEAPSIRGTDCLSRGIMTESHALSGITFTVFEGTYKFDEESHEAFEAREGGWLSDVLTVKSRRDVMRFIIKHCGKCELTCTSGTDFILGGKVDDARVINYKKAIEGATLDHLKSNSKKDSHLRMMLAVGGVLKWTFVWSAVYRWLNSIKKVKLEEAEEESVPNKNQDIVLPSIREKYPQFIDPRRHDYLVLSKVAEEKLNLNEDRFGDHLWEDSNIIDFKRVLDEVGRQNCIKQQQELSQRHKKKKLKSSMSLGNTSMQAQWQYLACSELDELDRWIVAGKHQSLWPFQLSCDQMGQVIGGTSLSASYVILYPDLFGNNFGNVNEQDASDEEAKTGKRSIRWDQISKEFVSSAISARLQLAKTMGAQITPHLHKGVTHVLCEMKGCTFVQWSDDLSCNIFSNEEHGMLLHDRLMELKQMSTLDGVESNVLLVTPHWVKEKWIGSL